LRGAIRAMTCSVPFRRGRKINLRRRERAVGLTLHDAQQPAALFGARRERRVLHSQGAEHPFLEVTTQGLARELLYNEAQPVSVDAVFPCRARIVNEWHR